VSNSHWSLLETFDAIGSWFCGVVTLPLHTLANYDYFTFSPLILGISQAGLLILLTVSHSWVSNLWVFWSTEFIRTKHEF
jgi:hypothetical protein